MKKLFYVFVFILLLSFASATSLNINSNTQLCGVQEYDSVTISNSAMVSICPYNGTAGTGILNFSVDGTFTLEAGSSINGNSVGYSGGTTGSLAGQGTGGGSYDGNGGGYGGRGGDRTTNGGGITYGTQTGYDLFIGSGGARGSYSSANGGDAGGALSIKAYNVNINGSITINGGSGDNGFSSQSAGGGGSGGSILIKGAYVTIPSTSLTVNGGSGGSGFGGGGGHGGSGGGGGRIKIFSYSLNNDSSTITANGGAGGSSYLNPVAPSGEDGTIYYEHIDQTEFNNYFVDMVAPADGINLNYNLVSFNVSSYTSGVDRILNLTLYTNETGSWNIRDYTVGLNTTSYNESWTRNIQDGFTSWYVGVCNTNDDCKTSDTIRTLYIDSQGPTITINEPFISYPFGKVGLNTTLNWSVSDINLDSCWYDYDGTNVSVSCDANETYFSLSSSDNRNLTFYANDTLGNLNSVMKFWDYEVVSTGEDYDAYVTETSTQDFSINLTYDSASWSGVSMKLNYDNVNYTATVTGTGDDISSSHSLDIPVASNVTDINDFYWILSLTNASGTYLYKTSTNTQTVSQVSFRICNYSESPQLYFNTFDLLNPTTKVNATFSSAWTLKLANGGTIQLNRSFQDLGETNNSWGFCISPNSSNYTVSVDIVVDATDFTPTTYYIVDTDYTSITQNISLYLLNESDATLTEVQVRTADNSRVEGAYVTVQRYDIGTDTYYTYAILKTDSQGSDLVYLKWYDDFYKFLATTSGELTGEDGPKKVSASPEIIEVGSTRIYEYDLFKQIDYSLIFNNDTNNFVLTYSDPTGIPDKYCLNVINRKVSGDTTICDTCAISTSATLYCNIATEGNGTFIANFYVTGSPPYFIDTLFNYVGIQNELFNAIGNDNGTGLAILTAGIVVALFLITPALGIIGMIAGMTLSLALGFQPLDVITFAGITVAGLLIAWAVKK